MFPSAAHQHLVLRVMQPYNWISVITVSVCSGNFYKDHSSWKGGTCASIFPFKFYARFQRGLNGRSNLFTNSISQFNSEQQIFNRNHFCTVFI